VKFPVLWELRVRKHAWNLFPVPYLNLNDGGEKVGF
jgi:hypothetical protein